LRFGGSKRAAKSCAAGQDLVHGQTLHRAVEPERDGVLELLGRVGLGEHLAEEELQEAPVVREHVAAVELLPPLWILDLVVPGLE
jgi:hypothetical protein